MLDLGCGSGVSLLEAKTVGIEAGPNVKLMAKASHMLIKKLRSALYRGAGPILATMYRRQGVDLGGAPIFYGMPLIQRHPRSSICIGERVVLCSDSRYTALALNHPVKIATVKQGASIEIGNDVGMSGSCIISAKKICVGSEVLMGANVLIVDTDFHPICPENRRFADDEHVQVAPVYIGNNVFLGTGAIVLKGVQIGDDSIVAAGAVVVAGTYPEGVVLAGNPARAIGSAYTKK